MGSTEKIDSECLLEDALNLYWLWPENALALASYVKYGVDIAPPSPTHKYADLACGDGINTFFKCGGRFSSDFDIFQSTIAEDRTENVVKNNIDVFNYYVDELYNPIVTKYPANKYLLGTDHKQNLLLKAESLDFYQSLLIKDLREEIVEIEDISLDLIYCNSLYWIKETSIALEFMKKKLKSNGRIILDVFTDNKKLLDWGKIYPNTPVEWQQFLNRGRQESNPGLRSEKDWENLFKSNNLEVLEKRNILPASLTWTWNLGLRPIFPMLNKMASNLTTEKKLEIKSEWIDVFKTLLLPILETPEEFSQDENSYRLQYVLKC